MKTSTSATAYSTITVGTSTFAAFSKAFVFMACKGATLAAARTAAFEGMESPTAGFASGMLVPGVTEFLLGEAKAFPFTEEQKCEIITTRMGQYPRNAAVDSLLTNLANEYGQLLREFLTDKLDLVGLAEDQFLNPVLEQEVELAPEPTIEKQIVEQTVEQIEDTASMYEALFSDVAVVSDARVQEAEPEPVIEPEQEVNLTELLEEVTQEVILHVQARQEETLEAINASVQPVQAIITEPIAEVVVQTEPVVAPSIETLIAQSKPKGLLAYLEPQSRQAVRNIAEQAYKQTYAQTRELKLASTKKPQQASRLKSAHKQARKQASKTAAKAHQAQPKAINASWHLGKATAQFCASKPLHVVYPYLGNSNNNGQPKNVGIVSTPSNDGRYFTAGNHILNHEEGFFYPSCVTIARIWDRFNGQYREQDITVPYILEVPLAMVQAEGSTNPEPNMVVADTDNIRACKPTWVSAEDTHQLVSLVQQGYAIIGESKPFNRKDQFVVLMPAQPKWLSLNMATETSVPYPAK